MSAGRRIAIGLAGLVAAPGVIVATAACLFIAFSIATETWYRNWFLGYGLALAALYATFVAGVIALALLVTRPRSAGFRRIAVILAMAGFAAACALEFELWDEAERVLPFGLLLGPYLAWAAAWLFLRTLPPLPPPPPQWEDTRL